MAQKKRGLGRGLDSLLSKDLEDTPQAVLEAGLQEMALDDLRPGRYQPRQDMDDEALESLAQSIRSRGVVQPLLVREITDGYEIVAGERRWRAARRAGLSAVPVVVREMDDTAAMAVALIENIQREDLNPLEEAAALRRLITECEMTHQECADAVGRSRAAVSNLLRLADLDDEIQAMLRKGEIEMGHARALLGADAAERVDLARKVIARGLSVRQTEQLVKQGQTGGSRDRAGAPKSPRIAELEKDLAQALGAPVAIKPGRRGGRVEIRYRDAGELDRLLNRFG
jgi:ParB family chromosome partitioning protein